MGYFSLVFCCIDALLRFLAFEVGLLAEIAVRLIVYLLGLLLVRLTVLFDL